MFTLPLLLTHCLASPLVPLVSPLVNLLQDDMMGEMMDAGAMAGGAGAAMDMADMTAMGEINIYSTISLQ